MEIIKPGTKINFVAYRAIALILSTVVILICLGAILIWPGPNAGIDFSGGWALHVHFKSDIDMEKLRDAVEDLGIGEVMVQRSNIIGGDTQGDNYLIRVEQLGEGSGIMSVPDPAEETEEGAWSPIVEISTAAAASTEGGTVEPTPAAGTTAAAIEDASTAAAAEVEDASTAAPAADGDTAAAVTDADTAVLAADGATASVKDAETLIEPEPEPEPEPEVTREPSPIEKKLNEVFGADSYYILKTDQVGPRVGADLRDRGIMAIAFALILILAYITLRFEVRFAIGAVVALVHDVVITTGAFVITGREFNLAIIAALLTIVGYSLNDTIVLFDRIRDNQRKMKRMTFIEMINASINEVLSRTLLTSMTTLVVVFFLWRLGGGVINDFAFALLIGVLVGTYSSIFVAGSFVIWWEESRAKRRSPAMEKK